MQSSQEHACMHARMVTASCKGAKAHGDETPGAFTTCTGSSPLNDMGHSELPRPSLTRRDPSKTAGSLPKLRQGRVARVSGAPCLFKSLPIPRLYHNTFSRGESKPSDQQQLKLINSVEQVTTSPIRENRQETTRSGTQSADSGPHLPQVAPIVSKWVFDWLYTQPQ